MPTPRFHRPARGRAAFAAVVALVGAVAVACDASTAGSGSTSAASADRAPSPSPSAPPSSTRSQNPGADEPTTRATSHAQVDRGGLPAIAFDDCSVLTDQTTWTGLMQTMAHSQYLPNGSVNSTFVGNAQELTPELTEQSQKLQAIVTRLQAAGYATNNPILTSLTSLIGAYSTIVTHLSAGQYAPFFGEVVDAQTAFDNLVYDVGNNCAD